MHFQPISNKGTEFPGAPGCEEAGQTPCCWDLLADLLLAGEWQTGGVTVSPNLAVPLAAAAQVKELDITMHANHTYGSLHVVIRSVDVLTLSAC